MPEICRFYGIIIFMNFKDHDPPHFHAWYGDYKILVTIENHIVKGEMPQRALSLIFEWMNHHEDELLRNWQNATTGNPLNKIDPLW